MIQSDNNECWLKSLPSAAKMALPSVPTSRPDGTAIGMTCNQAAAESDSEVPLEMRDLLAVAVLHESGSPLLNPELLPVVLASPEDSAPAAPPGDTKGAPEQHSMPIPASTAPAVKGEVGFELQV